mgnify:CR=1 FL=1
MKNDKFFLTYNQQMRKLRNDKNIICNGSLDKKILVRAGYFNIVNGYKNPFISGCDAGGNHIYISGTSLSQLQSVKKFDKLEHYQVISLTNVMIMEIFLGMIQLLIIQENLYKIK